MAMRCAAVAVATLCVHSASMLKPSHLRRIAVGEDSLAQHQRHDAIETEQRTGARHVGDRLGESEVGGVHQLEQARRHRRIGAR